MDGKEYGQYGGFKFESVRYGDAMGDGKLLERRTNRRGFEQLAHFPLVFVVSEVFMHSMGSQLSKWLVQQEFLGGEFFDLVAEFAGLCDPSQLTLRVFLDELIIVESLIEG